MTTIDKLQFKKQLFIDFNLFPESGVCNNIMNRINEVGEVQCLNDINTEINALSYPNLWLKHLLIDLKNEFINN